jgi:flagellar basal body-associated protein FliL
MTVVPTPETAPTESAAEEKPKSKKKLFIIVGVVVLLALVGFVAKGKLLKPHYPPGKVPPGQVYSLGSVTTSLADGHLIQTTIQLQLTVVANPKAVGLKQPQLLNAAIQTLGEQTYAGLLPPGGRTALKAALLKDFQGVLGTSGGAPEVDKVYLTSFVLQ